MKIPKRLLPLLEDGLIDDVVAQLKSGKEADVYVVRCNDDIRCAKVYKEANQRSFKQAVQYQEGRTERNSRKTRAMNKRTRFGQKEAEEAWLSAEVDALYRLAAAGVRAPKPYNFVDGVLIMELINGDDEQAAPRLSEVSFSQEQAVTYHNQLMTEIVRMLCAGLVHGDLSEFNVLIDASGPVIIDLPQAVNAAGNNNAQAMLERDVKNMRDYFSRYAPNLRSTQYGKEIWLHYESGTLSPNTTLTGQFEKDTTQANVSDVLEVIDDAFNEELKRRIRKELSDEDNN